MVLWGEMNTSIAARLARAVVQNATTDKPKTRAVLARELGINETYAHTNAPKTRAYKEVIANASIPIERRNKNAVSKMLNIRDTALDVTEKELQGNVALRDAVATVDTINSNILKLTGKNNDSTVTPILQIAIGTFNFTPPESKAKSE